jgi:hypothetical protein
MLYKLTDQDGYTRRYYSNKCKWGEGVTHRAVGSKDGSLCTNSFIHAYTSPYLAILMNPIHAAIENPILWKAKGFISKSNSGLKIGCYSLTTIEKMNVPDFSINQEVYFGILTAKKVYKDKKWNEWADNWISGKDRTANAAYAAADAANAAANAAYATNAAAKAAANAADYAANAAAYAAANAAYATNAAAKAAANAADYAANAAAYAAANAAYATNAAAKAAANAADYAANAAAYAAANADIKINFSYLAKKAYNFERSK